MAAAVAESDFADEFLRLHELARQGDLRGALAALRQLRERPGATEWARRTASYIVDLADDDLELAIKELAYSGRSFRGRTKNVNLETAYSANHSLAEESEAALFLSKKIGMGRNRRRASKEEGGAAEQRNG